MAISFGIFSSSLIVSASAVYDHCAFSALPNSVMLAVGTAVS